MAIDATPGPLSPEKLRKIAHDYASLIAAFVDTAPNYELSAQDISSMVAYVLVHKADISDAIIAEGCGCTVEEARQIGILKRAFLTGQILELTHAETGSEPIVAIIKEEIAPWSRMMTGIRH